MIPLDNSNHSTYRTIDEIIKDRSPSPEPEKIRTGRKVRINQRRNVFHDNTKSFEDVKKTWYGTSDYKSFRAEVKKVLSTFKEEAEKDYAKNMFLVILEDLYDTVRSIDYVVKGDCMNILTDEQKHNVLNLFKTIKGPKVQKASTSIHYSDFDHLLLIGLEFHAVPHITREAQTERENIQDVVDEVQGEYERGLWDNQDLFISELRDSCVNFSQASTLFGQFLARAQLEATRE
mmetsp:Transcript_9242/g.19938  ORF Transcript_9242/g.19938 Transcript_9242/m.19938 type:complete len:233 (+) Transcript_9242:126-824(+)|eukprot:CAMPEP_0168743792 /NCGR_PEP_ID=MMETSP0724-20121128/13760_1 /TAXON_ID=265536 /ORGANISM="Amphiprora sp., Strain CCMP467" /LENGTH=232 /DNA_ID=CAMNT_0008791435 /DNA_START=88 /DNA_END=786 /DNA_ORIENTATION=-